MINGIKRRIYRHHIARIVNYGNISSCSGEEKLLGYDINVSYPNLEIFTHQMLEIIFQDCYSVWRLPESPVVIDCGANIGLFSLNLLRLRPKAQVVLIEPDKDNLSYINLNMQQFRGLDFKIIPAAVSNKKGKGNMTTVASDSKSLVYNDDSEYPVDIITLESIINKPIDLLKIDIEGEELNAIHGAQESLLNVKRIICEYHDIQGSKNTIYMLLNEIGKYGFNRLRVYGHRDFKGNKAGDLRHCCLVDAWRA